MSDLTARKDMLSYAYGQINTPFKSTDQTEDREIGRHLKAAQFWRLLSFACLIGSLVIFIFSAWEWTLPDTQVIGANVFPNGFVESTGLLMEKTPS